jgi:predicted TIM-barrel fold metal-dependent hydrolase
MSSSAESASVFPQWVREVRAPVPLPPRKSCDCQAHIFGDPLKYPPRANAEYAPLTGATFDDLCAVERTLGFERFVIVHAQVYGTDFRLVTDSLAAMADHSHIRVIGRIDDSVSDRELERLHTFGFCGVRFGVRQGRQGPPDFDLIRPHRGSYPRAWLASATASRARRRANVCERARLDPRHPRLN